MQFGSLLRLGRFVFWLSLVAHWLACGWIALDGPTAGAGQESAYLHALYWCVTTLTTVGYGDVTPQTNLQMVYTMMAMVLGVGMYGYVIGNVARILANIDLARAHYRSTMERLSTFVRYRNISQQTAKPSIIRCKMATSLEKSPCSTANPAAPTPDRSAIAIFTPSTRTRSTASLSIIQISPTTCTIWRSNGFRIRILVHPPKYWPMRASLSLH